MSPDDLTQRYRECAEAIVRRLRMIIPNGATHLGAEDFAQSALRSALRQIEAGDLAYTTKEALTGWLIRVARRKYFTKLREAETARKHAGLVARPEHAPGISAIEASEATVAQLLAEADEEERILLVGKLQGRTHAEIANEIAEQVASRNGHCSATAVGRIWARICERWQERADSE